MHKSVPKLAEQFFLFVSHDNNKWLVDNYKYSKKMAIFLIQNSCEVLFDTLEHASFEDFLTTNVLNQ